MKKLLKKLSVMRLEERVLFDAAAAAAAVEAENQAQQNEELQQQQQQLQEQLAEEAARQQAAQEAPGTESELPQEDEAAGAQESAAQESGESAAAGSEVAAAIEAIAADEGVEAVEETELLEDVSDDVAGESVEGVVAIDVEADAEESAVLAETPAEIAAAIAEGSRHELVIVSGTVKDSKVIIDSLAEGTEVLVLDNESDVLDQINEYLDKSAVKYDAIHVVSHGGDGYLVLNNSVIDMESLQADPASWAAIGEHVSEDGDIMLYGCNVAQTENGKAFANQLASLTGADIAASVDVTGGDYGWELEYVTNAVATPVLSFTNYNARLASLTLVESGSGEDRDWNVNLHAAGTYYGFATGTTLTNSDGTTVESAVGQLYTVTVTEKAGEGGAPPTYEYKYSVEPEKGNSVYVLAQAVASEGSDTITVLASDISGNAELGNIAPAVNAGGLSISLGENVSASFNAATNLTGSLSITGSSNNVLTQIGGNFRVTNGGSVTISGSFSSVNLRDIEVVGGGSQFAIEGTVADIRISDSDGNNEAIEVEALGGSFTIDAQATGFEVGASNVIVNGDVRIIGSRFTVDLTGNSATQEESKFIVHGDFYARSGGLSGSQVSISVTDVDNPNISLDGAVVGMHYGTDGGGWVNFDSTQDASPYDDSAVIFDGSLYVNAEGHEGGSLHYANMSIDGGDGVVNYIYVKDDFIVGGARNTASFSASDFYSFYFDAGTGKVFSIGQDDSASFTAENRAHYNPSEWGRGYFGTRNRVTVDRQVDIAAGATLTINNLMMDIRDSVTGNNVDFSHLGDINGENSELVFREGVVISGTDYAGGTVHLHSVRYENGVEAAVQRGGGTGMLDTKFNFYHGEYGSLGIWLDGRTDYKIDMDLFQEITIHNVTFINQNNDEGLHVNLVDGGVGVLTGSSGSVTMEGEFAFTEAELPNTTFDFEVGSTVNVIYNRAFEQYVLSGNYYELTVTNTADKILAGNIVVGVSIDKIQELRRLYGTEDSKDAQIAARKLSHAYRGGISLGAGLRTMGYDVDFYGYTHAATEKAKIYSENAEGNVAGRVSYHVAQTLVNMDRTVQMTVTNPLTGAPMNVNVNVWDTGAVGGQSGLDMAGITATNHGVGPGVTGHSRTDEAYRAFYGGTYNNLTIDTMATLPPTAGIQWIPSEEITFTMDDSARIFGNMAVTAVWDGSTSTQHHFFTVNVTSDVVFVGGRNNIFLDDASLHFSGSVTGNFQSVTAVRDEYYSANGVNDPTSLGAHERQLSLTFDQKMGNIGLLHTDGVSITFESDVASIRNVTVGTPGLHTGKVNTRDEVLTFNGAVELVESVVTTRQFDDVKPIFNFNGTTTGNARFESFRSIVNFNERGDLTIFQGHYDDLNIAGEADPYIDGVKTIIGDTSVGGIFNANLANINIQSGTLSLQTFYEDYATDPHRPNFTVDAGAQLEFRAANTEGIRFYGTIESAGTITILGRGIFSGDITLTGEGNMVIDGSAEGSVFARVINEGSGFDIVRDITINELHNYGTITIHNNNVGIDVYNHAGGNLVFDLNAGTVGANGYEFTFDRGEGESNIEWNNGSTYSTNDEVRYDNVLYIAGSDVPAGVEPGVEYWREIEAFDSRDDKTYKVGDVVYRTSGGETTVYRALQSYVPGNSDLDNTDYWEELGTAADFISNTYNVGALVKSGTQVYVAMNAVAAGTVPGTTYWTPIANTAHNRLINGGTITVNNGTVNLNNFTQGDKNAETGRWTYVHTETVGGEEVFIYDQNFVVGQNGTLIFAASAAQLNEGNVDSPSTDSYLGTITNAGTVKVDAAIGGNIKFAGAITNAENSKFILENTGTTTFNGNFTHDGSLTATVAGADIVFGVNSVVTGSGTIGGVTGYNGTVDYNGAEQQILTGIYNDDVTLTEGVKTVVGNLVFNGSVNNSAVIQGNSNSIAFNADTLGSGSFAGTLDVTYASASSSIYTGSYGDLSISGNNRTIDADITAANLTLSGQNTFNGADAENVASLTVAGEIILGDSSSTTFGEFSSLNDDSNAAAVIKGGKNGGTLTFSTNAVGAGVAVFDEGLNAAVTYNYAGTDAQRILAGTYLSGMTMDGSQKVVSSQVSVTGNVLSYANAPLHVANGGIFEAIGTVVIDALQVDFGGVLSLSLTGASQIGTVDDFVTTDDITGKITAASTTGVVFGGELNLTSSNNSQLTVYGWQDVGSLGVINVNSGIINFAGIPDDVDSDPVDSLGYGYVNATLNNNAGAANVVDNGGRLQNVWVSIFQDAFTSELTDYIPASRFRVINGATLTVDHFALWNDANADGIKDEGEEYYITNAVEAFSVSDGATLIFDLTGGFYDAETAKTITVHDIHIDSGSQVIIREGNTVQIDRYADVDGVVSGAGNVNMTTDVASTTGQGTFNMSAGQVTYGNGMKVYGGIYNDLILDTNILTGAPLTVNGTADFTGVLSGNGKVTINGATTGNATFGDIANDKTYTGVVTYGAGSGAVFGGQYNNIVIEGDHSVAADINVNVIDGGMFRLNSTLTLNDGVSMRLNGLTDANAEGNTGRINGADTSTVTYGYNASIYGGTYGNLIANGTEYTLNNDVIINGEANLKGTFLGDVDVTFNGTTAGNALFGVIDDATRVFGGTVSYAATALTVYGGNYYSLEISGDRTLGASFAVNNSADIAGVMSGSANVTFAQGALLQGGAFFGAEGADYTGTVTYNGVDNVYGGFYSGLNFSNGNTVSTAVSASGAVQLAGALNVSSTGSVAFNGTTDANVMTPDRNTGVIFGDSGSKVSYGAAADVYNGVYGDLAINGDHTLLVNGEHEAGIIINGKAELSGIMSGNTKVTFNGDSDGDATFGNIASDTTYTGTVTYGVGATTIYGGQYNNIVIAGDSSVSHTVNSSLLVNVPSGGRFELASELILEENVILTLNGLTDANAEGNTGSITGHATSEVLYSGDADVYGGSYGKLTFTGSEYTLLNNFSVAADALINGNIIGSADIVFNGAVSGNAVFGNLETNVIYGGSVTYAPSADHSQTVFGGNYSTLNITGSHELNQKFAVNTAAAFNDGIMSGSADITFAQGAILTGNGTIGAAADNRYQGNVAYNGVSGETGVFGGFYSNLVLANGNSTSAAVDAADVKLSGVLTVTGTGSVNFAGTTDAAAADNDGSIAADAAASVSYAGTADVYGGTYGNLTITGDHTLYFDLTVNGLATITGIQTLEGSGTITFNGTTNADEAGSGTFADDMVLSTVVYSGTAAVFGGSYGNLNISGPHTLNNTLSVAGSAEFSGKQTLGSGVSMTLSGATNADAKDSEGNNIASIDGSAGSVTYNGVSNQGIYIGTYGNLTITGDHLLSNSFSVEGNFASGAQLSGTADVTFNGTTAADGTVFGTASEVYAGRVTYSETAATVYGGYYSNLVISGDHTLGNDFAVNTAAEITGVMSGTAKVTFAQDSVLTGGATFGAAADARYEGEVVYNGVETVYGGFYSALTLDGGNTVSVDVDVLNAKLSDVLTVTGTGSVNFAGTTDAAAADNDGSIAADATASVSYAGTADVYGGTYGNLTITGDHTLYFDVTVNGLATITGIQTLEGSGTITFNGTTNADDAGSGTFADDAFVSTVTYGAQAAVFGGSYGNLTINGDHTLTQDFSVSANAVIEGVISGTAAVQLLGVNSGSGSFGRSADERYNGIVTYDANEILSGFYGGAEGSAGLIINNGAKVLQNVVVDAYSVELNGALAVAEGGTMRFSGYTDALVKGNAAQIDSDGVVDYAVTADIYGGKYTDLVIRGDRYFRSSLTVLGTTTIYDNADDTDASLTSADGVQLIFSGAVNGNGAYFGDGTNAVAASVTYNSAEGEILGGIYNDLTVTTARALSNNFEVTGSAVFGGNQTLESGVEIRFTGSTNGNESVEFEGAADSSVYYKEGVTVYNGSYGTLILDGAFTLTDKTITASTEAVFNGRLTLAGNTSLTLSGVNSGTIDQISAGADTTVVYNGAADQTVFAGTYGNLEITGAHTLTNSFSVAGKTDITGTQTLSGAVEIAFNGVTNGSESDGGTLVDDTEDGILSSVSYSGEADVFSGSYGNLTITGDHVLIKDFSVEGAFASGALLSGDANVTFNGTTADDGTRFGDERSSYAGHVIYGTTAESVYQGSYADLTITGDHVLANDFSVAGAAVITGTQTLKGAVAIEFNGTTNAAEGAIFNDDSSDSEFSTVTYAGEADVYTGTYGDLTINGNSGQSTAVIGDLTVQGMLSLADNDMYLIGDGDWTIGKTNASEDHSATIYNDGTVTYNGLAAGESGWIFNGGGYENGAYYEGAYENLVVIGGNYSVNSITIQGTVTGDATGKIIFQNRVGGEGVAQNVNADYMSDALIFKGTYNDLGINRSANFAEEVTVNGRFSALSSNAIVEGGSTLTLAGTMEGFNGLGRFYHLGEVKITGTAAPFEFTGGHIFETLNVGAGTTTYLAQTTVRNSTYLTGAAIYGSGDIYIGAEVYINAPISMTGGTVTYQADATDMLFDGVYYNLNLEQSATLVMTQKVTVTNLLDVNSHDILNNNELTVYTFTDTADSTLINLGTLTFGSYDDTVTAPAVRQVWEGLIANGITLNDVDYTGTLIINRSNYTINNIYNYEGSQITVDYGAAPAGTEDVVQVGVFSEINSIINLRADVVLYDGDDHTRFTNYGTLNISGHWGALSSMHVFNLTQSTINVTDGQFTFGDNIRLTNSGLVVAGSNGELTFAEVNENLSGRPVYQTADGGVFKFDFASDSINISNGLLGELKNYDGAMYFLTDGMKYLGKLTNGRGTDTYGYAYFWADTTLKESVVSTFGILQVGNGSDDISVNFLHNVVTNSRFEILNNAHAVFESIVSVVHEFYMESGSSALFMDEVRVYSTSNNQFDTIFHVKAGADATFLSDVFNQNGYGFHERDKWTVTLNNAVQSITGSFSKAADVYTDIIIGSKDWASDSDKLSKLVIDGHVVINGKVSNIAYGWNSDDNQANVVVNSDGNVFGAIDNRGSAARLDMNGSNNQFNGAIFNTGNIYLNGTNDYNDLQTAHCSISFTISSEVYTDQTINNGYVWVNDGATGSTFREIKIGANSGVEAANPTFTVVSYNNEGIDLTFTGEVFNWGRFNINSDGSVFNRDVVNYNQFRINGVAQFNALFTNNSRVIEDVTEDGGKRLFGAELSIGAAGTRFNQISNAGIIGVDAYTILEGSITNTGIINFNVSGMNFSNIVNNGVINLHNAKQIVVQNLTIGESSVIDIDKLSSLHLHVVSEEYTGDYDNENYNYADDAKLGTIFVRGDARNGLYEAHTTPDVSDSEHGLFFEDTGKLQTISSRIVYDTLSVESAIWFNSHTVLNYEDATWIIVHSGQRITLDEIGSTEKYKVMTGGSLTVKDTASGTRIQVNGGTVIFDNDDRALTITGLLEVRSGTAVFDSARALNFTRNVFNAGTVTFNGGSVNNFNGGFTNAATGVVNAQTNVNGHIVNSGMYNTVADGIVIGSSFTNTATGTLSVTANTQLEALISGTINVQQKGTLTVEVTEINSNLLNNGTVVVSNSANYLGVTGSILKGNGTFTSADPATLVFAGDVATGTAAVFQNIYNVEYTGTSENGQNIILGTYNNLTLNGAFKVVDDGAVIVNGGFANNNEVKITDDGELILNGNVAGNGIYSNEGLLVFSETASGSAATVNNSGVANVNADNFNVASGSNTGSLNINGDGVSASVENTGSLIINGNDVDLNTVNNGSVTVNGSNADLAGQNNSSVTVNGSAATTMSDQAGASYNVAQGGALSLGDNGGTYNAAINNKGTVTVDAPVNSFAGGVNNEGVVAVNSGNGLDFAALMNGNANGTVALNDEIDLRNRSINGTVEVNYSLTDEDVENMIITENSVFGINSDSTFKAPISTNNGTVRVGRDAELTLEMQDAEIKGNYDIDGVISVRGDSKFTDSVDNSGTIKTEVDGEITFAGSTSGAGRVEGNAVYEGSKIGVFGGDYSKLTIINDATLNADAVVETLALEGSLATAEGASMTINGETLGTGTMAGGKGEIVYNGNSAEQTIYAGQYNDITIGQDATGNFDIAGDIAVQGDAFNRSTNGAELAVSSGTVTYNGTGTQNVMAGTYDELIMAGSGSTKLMETDVFNVNSFISDGGSHSGMITLTSAEAPGKWTLNAVSSSIDYSFVDYADTTKPIFLNGTNMTGSGNSHNWALFNGAGGVGDSFPSINNPNFQAIAPYMSDLHYGWAATDRFDIFRRMPVDRAPIVVGDMSDLVVLNNFEAYDMIDFDGEFFGQEGISILDEEAREVLDDAASAEAADLKALLED